LPKMFYPVVLSAARVPGSRDERKSKDPEDMSPCHTVPGSSLVNIPFALVAAISDRFLVFLYLQVRVADEKHPGTFSSTTALFFSTRYPEGEPRMAPSAFALLGES